VWALVRRQHGVVSRRQLLALGYSRKAIEHRIAKQELHVVWRGVYAVGRPELTRRGELMAAALACGRGAVLSHDTAAELWEIRPARKGVIHVSVRDTSARRLPGVRVHRRPTLEDADMTRCHRIPVTTPVRTLIDIAAQLRAEALETAINEGNKRELFDPQELRAEVDKRGGLRGVGRLRTVLDRRTLVVTDSVLERWFLPLSERAGLPQPQTQAWVNGVRVDFYYAEIGLVVETDGLRYHRTPAQQARDRIRDQAHTAAGLTTLRFTHDQVRHDPSYVCSTLASVAARAARAARSAGSSGPRRLRAASAGRPWL
jgi:very-short-patch-repair endonuclease